MGKKFDSIFESVVSRLQIGGYLPGDIVKFRSDYKSTPTYKSMNSKMRLELDELIKSGLNIKVVQVGSKNINTSSALDHKTADNIVLTVAGDHGGGRHFGSIAVSADMLDLEDAQNPSPNIPDQFVRKDNTNWKPEEYKPDNSHITRQTDKGNGKNTPTSLKLAGESTRLKKDANNITMLYENMYKVDYEEAYRKVLIEEGLLRRIATKISGGFGDRPLKNQNKINQFAKSVAYEVGKDISKAFGGDTNTHTEAVYNYIVQYLNKQLSVNTKY